MRLFNLRSLFTTQNKEQLAGAKFTAGDGYTVNSDTQVTIATLAAGASIDLNAEYTVTDDSVPSYTNIVEITDAKADNDWDLVCDDEHCKADEEFKTISIRKPIHQ